MAPNASAVNADIVAGLRSRKTLFLIRTDDEQRVISALIGCAASAKFPEVLSWSCSSVGGGFVMQLDPNGGTLGRIVDSSADPGAALTYIANQRRKLVCIMLDLHKWIDPVTARTLRTMSQRLQAADPKEARAIVLVAPMSADVQALRNDTPELLTIDYPLPDRAEVEVILDQIIASLSTEELRAQAAPNGMRDRVIDGALGLSALQITNSYSTSLVKTRKIDPLLVANEKKAIIAGIPGATWYDADPRGLDAIGGNGELKAWALSRRAAFSERAREFGLPTPKGVMLVGPPGTGKSLAAKCLATAFGMPLIRADIGGTKSKYVGDSEANIRRLLSLAETVAPCVLWVDEIEKALAGATGPQGDGGVSSDALGVLLSWMQEKTAPVFVVATANDVRALPPELLRKGRFDELFFVDVPNASERVEILVATLKERNRPTEGIDLEAISQASNGFVGAEIAAMVPDALYLAFADSERALTTDDLLTAAGRIVPLSKTMGERLEGLRSWAKGRARMASKPEANSATSVARALDL